MWKVLTILVLATFANCNIWDKILNNDESIPTIKIDTDLHAQYPLVRDGQNFKVELDYDIKSQTATIRVLSEVKIFILDTQVEMFQIQTDFKQGLVIYRVPLGCKNYETWKPTQNLFSLDSDTMERYVNTVFEYKRSAGDMFEFEFNPQYRGKLDERTLEKIPKLSLVVNRDGRVIELIAEGKTVPVISQSKVPKDQCDSAPQKPDLGLMMKLVRDLSVFAP